MIANNNEGIELFDVCFCMEHIKINLWTMYDCNAQFSATSLFNFYEALRGHYSDCGYRNF